LLKAILALFSAFKKYFVNLEVKVLPTFLLHQIKKIQKAKNFKVIIFFLANFKGLWDGPNLLAEWVPCCSP